MEKEIKIVYPRPPAQLLALIAVAIFESTTQFPVRRQKDELVVLTPTFPQGHPRVIVPVTTPVAAAVQALLPPTPVKDETSYDDF
jgi:hypothetical protein